MVTSVKHHVSIKDNNAVRNLIGACKKMAEDCGAAFAANAQRDQIEFQGKHETINNLLHGAINLGSEYLHRLESVSPKSKEETIPNEILAAIQKLDKSRVMNYVQATQGTLSAATIDKIRVAWRAASEEARWVQSLHSSLHTAVALKNSELLKGHIEAATAHNNYSDDVVETAKQILVRLQREEAAAAAALAEESEREHSDAKVPEIVCPEPVIPALTCEWDSRKDSRGKVILDTYGKMIAVLKDRTSNTVGMEDPKKIRVPEDTPFVREAVISWISLLAHRAKPVGFFTKTERTLLDIVRFVGNCTKDGNVVAPYTNRLLSDFERIKKFNNPNGQSATTMFMRYLLKKHNVQNVAAEFSQLPRKDMEELFMDDSVFLYPPAAPDIAQLCSMTEQIEWSFDFQEHSEFAARNNNAVTSPVVSMDPKHMRERAVHSLRKAINVVSKLFSDEMKKLGTRAVPAALASIFDEKATKAAGIVVRDHVCPAVMNIFMCGFKSTAGLFRKHPWEMLVATAERLRESARDLGGVAIPNAVELVLGISDPKGKHAHSNLAKLSDTQLYDIRMRIFIMHGINEKRLGEFMETIFDVSPTNESFLQKYFFIDQCCMMHPEARAEILKVLSSLSKLPFFLHIDAEVW